MQPNVPSPAPTVSVFARNVYGLTKVYPHCHNAHLFAQLAGKKTLDKRDLQLIHELGFVVAFVSDPDMVEQFGGAR